MAHIEDRRGERAKKPWRVRYRDPSGKERSRSFAKKVHADRFSATVEADMIRGSWVDPAKGLVSVTEWGARYMKSLVGIKAKTLDGYEGLRRNHIEPVFGGYALSKLEPLQIREWVAHVSGRRSASQTRQAYRLLSAMLTAAAESGYIVRSPCVGVTLPRLPEREMLVISPAEIEDLAVEAKDYGPLILTLGYGGVRWGEAVALRRARCNISKGRLVVAEGATEIKGQLIFGQPKTYQRRSVALPPFLRDVLANHLAQRVGEGPDALVFTAAKGGPLEHGNFYRRVFKLAVSRAGLPPELRMHDLRHSCASILIRQRANVKQVQKHLGHRSATVTLDRYAHLWPDDLDRVAEALETARSDSLAAQMRPTSDADVVALRPAT